MWVWGSQHRKGHTLALVCIKFCETHLLVIPGQPAEHEGRKDNKRTRPDARPPTLAWVLEMTTHGTAMAAVVLETEHTHTNHSCNRRRLLRRFSSSCAEGAASLVPELEEVGVEGGSSCFFRMAAYI